ncbi:ZIP family transporter [Halopiger thermotolerans]
MTGAPTTGAADLVAVLVPAFALGLALVHLYAGRLRFLDAIPRSRWLSLAGGVSVGYVFVHVLPEVGAAAEAIDESETVLAAVDHHIYLVTLAGFVVFYGLERFVRERSGAEADDGSRSDGGERSSRSTGAGSERRGSESNGSADREPTAARTSESSPSGVFWLHTTSFAAYNALIGYLLLHREESGVASLTLFFVAMALHFVVNDAGLRDHHGRVYHRYGRWLLAGAVLLGTVVGYAMTVSEFTVALLFAFLAGGVILNVVKEELPEERQSRFWAFAVGAAGYTLLLLAV